MRLANGFGHWSQRWAECSVFWTSDCIPSAGVRPGGRDEKMGSLRHLVPVHQAQALHHSRALTLQTRTLPWTEGNCDRPVPLLIVAGLLLTKPNHRRHSCESPKSANKSVRIPQVHRLPSIDRISCLEDYGNWSNIRFSEGDFGRR